MDHGVDTTENVTGYRARIRFLLNLAIKSDVDEAAFEVDGTKVVLSGRTPGKPLDDKHLVMNVRGLPSLEAANEVGARLRRALIVKAALRRTGLDLGENKATTMFFKGIKDSLKEEHGFTLRDDVHGLDVFYDDGTVGFMNMSAMATLSSQPDFVFPHIEGSLKWVDGVPDKVLEAAQLLNAADHSGPPVVALVLSLAALEALAPALPWSANAVSALNAAMSAIAASDAIPSEERQSLQQSLNPVRDFGQSLGKKVKRLLVSHGLSDLAPKLTKAAAVRSKLLHGTHVGRTKQQEAAGEAREVAQAVVIAELQKCGVNTDALLILSNA